MADLSITAANVVKISGSQSQGTAGAAITAGQAVYIDAANGAVVKPASANTSSTTAVVVGIALHAAATNQPIDYLTSGSITIGATTTVGKVYVASANSGAICPVADLASGWYTTIIGYAPTNTTIQVGLVVSNTAN